ncbi:MAG: DUF3047 domain-containing protein [Comamonadaceae bacterium]|nr:MAG: DUF3047 domain-containing protein [Comamonadaceae bacterium]
MFFAVPPKPLSWCLPSVSHLSIFWRLVAVSLFSTLTACAGTGFDGSHSGKSSALGTDDGAHDGETPAPSSPPEAPSPWSHKTFPGKKWTQYAAVRIDRRDAIRSDSVSSASMLRQKVRVEPADIGKVAFSWKVNELIKDADVTQRDTDDSPVRVVLVFDGDRTTFSAKNAMLSELAYTLTGEPLPYATLMYVWDNQAAKESIVVNTRTDRIRKIVMESGPLQLGRWLDYERDIRADYEKVFGEAPGALVGIGVMTDSDNTRQSAQAWYGPVTLRK